LTTAAEELAPATAEDERPEVASPYLEAVAVGARVAGMVVALAYLTGWLEGPLLAAVGGLALVAFGHALLLERVPSVVSSAAFAVFVTALSVGALRWATMELIELRGVQSVLGPTVLVERTGSAQPWLLPAASWVAGVAALLAIAAWIRFPRGEVWFSLLPWAAELLVAGLAVASVFWGPAATSFGSGDTGEIWSDLGRWALATVAVALPAAGFSYLFARLGRTWTMVALCVAASAALSAAGVTAAQVLS
jgi:hypothetical protein